MKFYKIKGDCFHILVFQKEGKTYFELNKLDTLVHTFYPIKILENCEKKCWGPIYAIWQVSVSTASTAR